MKSLFALSLLGVLHLGFAMEPDQELMFQQLGLTDHPTDAIMWDGTPLTIPLAPDQERFIRFPNPVRWEIPSTAQAALDIKLRNQTLYITGNPDYPEFELDAEDTATGVIYVLRFVLTDQPLSSSLHIKLPSFNSDVAMESTAAVTTSLPNALPTAAPEPSTQIAVVRYLQQTIHSKQHHRDLGLITRPWDLYQDATRNITLELARGWRGRVVQQWHTPLFFVAVVDVKNPYNNSVPVALKHFASPRLEGLYALAGYVEPNQSFALILISSRPLEETLYVTATD